MSDGALDNLRVLDVSQGIAGPYCGRLFAGMGAEVIKVEPPGVGDVSRKAGPFPDGGADPDSGGRFLYLNAGKKSVTLDLEADAGRDVLRRLAANSDVLIESFPLGAMDGMGLGMDALQAANPMMVLTSVTFFGRDGPYSGFRGEEIVTYALSGAMFISGEPDREPLMSGVPITQFVAGQTAFVATMGALFHVQATGSGQRVEVSVHRAMADLMENHFVGSNLVGRNMVRTGNRHMNHPWGPYPCKDGYVAVICGPPSNWPAVAEFIDPRLGDPRFATVADRVKPENRDAIDAILRPWLMERTKEEICRLGQEHGLAFGYMATPEDVVNSAQLDFRGYFVELEHPKAGPFRSPGGPFQMVETPWQNAMAPLLGEHNAEVLGGVLGLSRVEIARMEREWTVETRVRGERGIA